MPKQTDTLPRDPMMPDALYDALEPFGVDWARGRIGKGAVMGQDFVPHTVTSWLALTANPQAVSAIERAGFGLIKPYPFGYPLHPDSKPGNLIAGPQVGSNQLTDEQYRGLSLRDKIAHHETKARQVWAKHFPLIVARVKSRDIAVLRQDGEFQALERLERNHLDEASRLKGKRKEALERMAAE